MLLLLLTTKIVIVFKVKNYLSHFKLSYGSLVITILIMVTGTLNAQNEFYLQNNAVVYVVGNNGSNPMLYVNGTISLNGAASLMVDSINAWTRFTGNFVNSGTFRADPTAREDFASTTTHQTISGATTFGTQFGNVKKLQGSGYNIILAINAKFTTLDFGTNPGKVDVGTNSKTLTIIGYVYNGITSFGQATYVDVGTTGHLSRNVNDITAGHYYDFPMGNSSYGYRNFAFNLMSLGGSGANGITGNLATTGGSLTYTNRYPNGFSGTGHVACVVGSHPQYVSFSCISSVTYHFTGPSDYTYIVRADSSGCGSDVRRTIQSPSGTTAWAANIGNTTIDSGSALCAYSDWTGAALQTPGGPYFGLAKDFAVGGGSSIALPVKLISLEAVGIDDQYIRVNWATATEISNRGFYVMRSTDAITWDTLSFTSSLAPEGVSNQKLDYVFNDHKVVSNTVYYYRLTQVDIDGHAETTDIVSAELGNVISHAVVVYPNPSKGGITVMITASDETQADIQVYDMIGRMVYQTPIFIHNNNRHRMNLEVPAGEYQMRVVMPQQTQVFPLVIIK
jgi:hypothetical protein